MMRLDEIFEVFNGLPSSEVTVYPNYAVGRVPFMRPSSSQNRTLAGWVDKSAVKKEHCYPPETLFVSTDGEGSHTYAYVSQFEFVPNSNVAVLTPKKGMTANEKLFYASCITLNRYKFSYGRKPKGERLKSIDLPDKVPEWVSTSNASFQALKFLGQPCIEELGKKNSDPPECASTLKLSEIFEITSGNKLASIRVSEVSGDSDKDPDLVSLDSLFDITYGTSLELNRLEKAREGVNFVSRTSNNNGVSAVVAEVADVAPIAPEALTVALGGSVLETFYQRRPFYTGFHVAVLRPIKPLTPEELLFYCAAIRANQYRYSYGRQANKTLKSILVPARRCVPAWVYGSIVRVCDQVQSRLPVETTEA